MTQTEAQVPTTANDENKRSELQVGRGTLGHLKGLGIVEVLTDQDAEGRVSVRELVGNAKRVTEGITASTIERISNRPGSAKNQNNKEESQLQMAQRLAGRSQQGQQKPQQEALWMRGKPLGCVVKVVYKEADGKLYIRVTRIDERMGLQDVPVSLRLVGEGSRVATTRNHEPIAGEYYSFKEFEIVIGDGDDTPQQAQTTDQK